MTGGLSRCWKCGAALVARPNGAGKRCYVCSRDHGGCGAVRILAEPLEDYVREAVFVAVAGPAFDQARAAALAARDSSAAVELAAAERRLDQLAEQYADGSIGIGAYGKATTRIEARVGRLRMAAASEAGRAVTRQLPSGEAALGAWWESESASVEQRAEVVALVVDAVTIGPGVRGLNKFDPRRVEIRWRV